MLDPRQSAVLPEERSWPAWLISAIFHAVMIILLGLLIRSEPRGAVEEPSRSGGIVLKQTTLEGEIYKGEPNQNANSNSKSQIPVDANQEAELAALAPADAGLDLGQELPALPTLGASPRPGGGVGDASGATTGGGGIRRGGEGLAGGKSRVKFYDLEGEGSKFVFVLDRSESMRGSRLASAKRELIASLESLEPTNQFQIIFFNHSLTTFDLTGGQQRIAFATDEAKQRAKRFINGIKASGGTDCAAALLKAVSYRPDVIFFLTDADDTVTASQLEKIKSRNVADASINTVQFGESVASGQFNFLMRLAQQSGGRSIYVNTARLRKAQ